VPVYDYVCSSCRHRFEAFHGLNEAGPHVCPLCDGPVSRAFAPPTIHFKGTGWAKKDRRASAAPSRKAAAGQAKGGESTAGDAAPTSSGSGESTADGAGSASSGSGESRPAASASSSSGSGD